MLVGHIDLSKKCFHFKIKDNFVHFITSCLHVYFADECRENLGGNDTQSDDDESDVIAAKKTKQGLNILVPLL